MRAVAVAILATLAAVPARAEQTPLPDARHKTGSILFAGIPWGMSADSVAARLAAAGYRENRAARTADRLAASGTLFERFVTIQARLDDQGRLARWEIDVPTQGERDEYEIQRKLYDDAVAEMLSKYGRRQQAVERYRFPNARGDGHEARGIRQGTVLIRSGWTSRERDRLTIEIDRSMSVLLTYESRWWRKIEDERRRSKAKDL